MEGLDVAGVSIPAFEVGGDYFDYLNGLPDRLTVMVGDVSGKGTSAALYMSKLQGILRSLHGFDLSPRELFVRTNQLLCHDLETAIVRDRDRRLLRHGACGTWCWRAPGHLPLYHYRADRREVVSALPRGLGFGLSTRPIFADQLEEQTIAYRARRRLPLRHRRHHRLPERGRASCMARSACVEAFVAEVPRHPTAACLAGRAHAPRARSSPTDTTRSTTSRSWSCRAV